jgi:hypothetical protein
MVYPHPESVARRNVAHLLDEASARGRRGGDFEEHGVVCFRGDQANRYAGSIPSGRVVVDEHWLALGDGQWKTVPELDSLCWW